MDVTALMGGNCETTVNVGSSVWLRQDTACIPSASEVPAYRRWGKELALTKSSSEEENKYVAFQKENSKKIRQEQKGKDVTVKEKKK